PESKLLSGGGPAGILAVRLSAGKELRLRLLAPSEPDLRARSWPQHVDQRGLQLQWWTPSQSPNPCQYSPPRFFGKKLAGRGCGRSHASDDQSSIRDGVRDWTRWSVCPSRSGEFLPSFGFECVHR